MLKEFLAKNKRVVIPVIAGSLAVVLAVGAVVANPSPSVDKDKQTGGTSMEDTTDMVSDGTAATEAEAPTSAAEETDTTIEEAEGTTAVLENGGDKTENKKNDNDDEDDWVEGEDYIKITFNRDSSEKKTTTTTKAPVTTTQKPPVQTTQSSDDVWDDDLDLESGPAPVYEEFPGELYQYTSKVHLEPFETDDEEYCYIETYIPHVDIYDQETEDNIIAAFKERFGVEPRTEMMYESVGEYLACGIGQKVYRVYIKDYSYPIAKESDFFVINKSVMSNGGIYMGYLAPSGMDDMWKGEIGERNRETRDKMYADFEEATGKKRTRPYWCIETKWLIVNEDCTGTTPRLCTTLFVRSDYHCADREKEDLPASDIV